MRYRKLCNHALIRFVGAILVFHFTAVNVCPGQNFRKISFPVLTVEAENFVSNSGNVVLVNSKNRATGIKTNGDGAWLTFKINIPVSGRYNIRLYATKGGNKVANCWLEDYVNNKDGRSYNITGNMVVAVNQGNADNFIQIDAAPVASGWHYIKLHIEGESVIVDKITFTLVREHKGSPIVLKQNTTGNDWQLVWSDEFNGKGLPDSNKWQFDIGNWGWGNNELQYYTNKKIQNARQENGNLVIEARKNDGGLPWSSARLTTRGKESFLYGKIEIRAKVPVGRGTWSAGWLLGDEYTDELSWPYCGEIDVLENVGFELDEISGNGKTHASVHCGAYYFKLLNQPTSITDVEDMSNTFHTYSLNWFPDSIHIYVDGKRYFEYKDTSSKLTWPFSNPQNLILNLAIGGGWGGAKGVDSTMTSQKFIIDYVRVYELQKLKNSNP